MPKSKRISIVIPVHNSAGWISRTFEHIEGAVKKSDFDVELIIVDDGSTDASLREEKQLQPSTDRLHVKLIEQSNKGRYLARKVGVEASTADYILFIDSRVFIHEDSLAYLSSQLDEDMDQVWNGHVHVVKKGNVFARFWDALVCIAWRRYFGNPREVTYGLDDFDYYPKGTGFFFVSKKLLLDGMEIFEKQTNDIKFSSDDTLLIRYIAGKRRIHLSPQFSCLYNGRSTFKGFLKHAYHRGQFFVDGFLRPGNRFFFPLLCFLAICLAAVAALCMEPVRTLAAMGCLLIFGMIGLFGGAVLLRVNGKDAASLALLGPIFAAVYGAGIWRGVMRKVLKKSA